ASPDTSTPQRFATTVPQQALFLMNSPFAIEQARHFVQRADVQSQAKDEAKINRMYQLAFGRAGETDEIALGLRYLTEARKNEGEKKGGVHLPAWEQYAQVLLLSNEFAFVD
ncbi:MAG TPA: DUF1553 domain-containing protein, partial [Gemmataceae bacterium]